MDSNEHVYIEDLHKLFNVLRAKETVGINIEQCFVDKVHVSSKPYPHIFNIDFRRPKCFNYPESAFSPDECSGAPANMSQVSNINNSTSMEDISHPKNGDHCSFLSDGDEFSISPLDEEPEQNSGLCKMFDDLCDESPSIIPLHNDPLKNPYGYLKMTFAEMTEVMKGNLSLEELNDVKEYFNSVTNELLKRVMNKNQKNGGVPQGNIVSSNTPFKKTFKTHGTDFL